MVKVCFKSMTVLGVMLVGLVAHANHQIPQITCPDGFAKVPGNAQLGTIDFCVMKYEAKAWKDMSGTGHVNGQVDPGEIKANGCDGTGNFCDGGTSNWGLSDHRPVSVEHGKPWRRISRDNATAECQSLGQGYDLISNAEWQTIARNIELQAENWSGQRVGAGCLSQGNTYTETACSYTAQGPERGGDPRASHALSNGEEIYHFSGNIWEWVKDNNTSRFYDSYIANLTDSDAKLKFGPEGSYTSCNSQNNYCGLGYGFSNYGESAVIRGGGWGNDGWGSGSGGAGVFAAHLRYGPSDLYSSVGFRCVLHSQSNGGTPGGRYE